MTSTAYDQWQQIHTDRPWGAWPCEDIVAACCRHQPDRAARGYALDIGCGTGNHLRFLSESGWTPVGLDVPAALDRCPPVRRARFVACDLDDSTTCIEALTWRPYDLVIDNVSTCYLHEAAAERIYAHLTTTLTPGTLLIVRDFRALPSTHAPAGMRAASWWRKVLRDWGSYKMIPVRTANAVLWHIEAIR